MDIDFFAEIIHVLDSIWHHDRCGLRIVLSTPYRLSMFAEQYIGTGIVDMSVSPTNTEKAMSNSGHSVDFLFVHAIRTLW